MCIGKKVCIEDVVIQLDSLVDYSFWNVYEKQNKNVDSHKVPNDRKQREFSQSELENNTMKFCVI